MEKKKIYRRIINKTALFLALPLLYYFILAGFKTGSTTEPETTVNIQVAQLTPVPNSKNFVNAIFNGGIWPTTFYPNRLDWIENQLSLNRYNELNFNTIHLYDYINGDNNGTDYYGKFADPLSSQQITNTNGLLNLTQRKGFDILLERSKISKLCYAQRLVYEISDGGSTTNNSGFCWQYCGGDSTTDQGRTVLYASDTAQNFPNGYWLARNIYENLQHSDLYGFGPQIADSGTWHMKPMMRIDSSIVDNYPEKPVVRIVVNNYNGDTIKTIIIKARNFAHFDLTNGYVYDGRYVDIFDFALDPGTDLTVPGSKTTGLGYNINDKWWEWDSNCKIDFKVYWMGEVPVYFDKMTVDDFYANKLFDPNPIVNFNSKIEEEVTNFGNHNALYSFFADECSYSNILCIKYVDSLMKYYNPNSRLHIATTNYFTVIGLKNKDAFDYMYQQNPGLYSINPDAHELSRIMPYQFNNADTRFADDWKGVDNNDYNLFLQYRAFGDRNAITGKHSWNGDKHLPSPIGSLVYQIELSRQKISQYAPGTKMIMQPQIQLWAFYSLSLGKFLYGQREPTKEEIEAQAMISIAHGADGICWFLVNCL